MNSLSEAGTDGRVDLMYLAWNRLEFTRESFETLVANTEWRLVNELFVYDDGSTDGTREWLNQAVNSVPGRVRVVETGFHSPVAAMVHFIENAQAPILAKIDNDVMVPPGWLKDSLSVFERHPQLSLLGIEALKTVRQGDKVVRSFEAAEFVSGLGLYRRTAFARGRPKPYGRWFGFEDWQRAQGPDLVRGWIKPALPVFLLDRLPFEPWQSYKRAYVHRRPIPSL